MSVNSSSTSLNDLQPEDFRTLMDAAGRMLDSLLSLASTPGASSEHISTIVGVTATASTTTIPKQAEDYVLLGALSIGASLLVSTTPTSVAAFVGSFGMHPEALLFIGPTNTFLGPARINVSKDVPIYVSTSTQGQWTLVIAKPRLNTDPRGSLVT